MAKMYILGNYELDRYTLDIEEEYIDFIYN